MGESDPEDRDTSINALKSILDLIRNAPHQCDIASHVAGQSTKSSNNAVIDDPQSHIQTTSNAQSNISERELSEKHQVLLQAQFEETREKCHLVQRETEKTNQCIIRCREEIQALREEQWKLAEERLTQLERTASRPAGAASEPTA